MPTDPGAIGHIERALAFLGALLAGGGGLWGAQRIRGRNGKNGVGFAEVVEAIRDEGKQTRAAIYDTSAKEIEKTGEVALGVAILVDRGKRE